MVRVTPFLPLISTAALLAPTSANRQESYAAVVHPTHVASLHMRRQLLTCEQTYGLNWTTCGDAASTFCYNPSEGQVRATRLPASPTPIPIPQLTRSGNTQACCAQDAGYCDAGTWCAPVAGFCCLDGEDVATCAREAGFEVPASSGSGADTTVSSTTTFTRSSTTTTSSSTTTSTTLSGSGSAASSGSEQLPTSCTTVGGLTWTSVYPATITGGFVNGSSSTNSTDSAVPSSTFVRISVAQKEQWTLVWMTVAIGVVGVFMATC
ncbi:hypothetical protein CONLIGDRAFT_41516 [Coniochaeta ligniaria NRRL 30616]|uniref:Chitin-binding type-1 domain-containing protein n=1 Tax=Coniochaeta ligniaria NRRL 30616 TaxID=1408157 RepID=A0A1J7JY87_9PEZI|nr:hypothetical protein CONLIGDRAFT_41516 [Coniochaeta ligniaria NRRL 30616]